VWSGGSLLSMCVTGASGEMLPEPLVVRLRAITA
jgi:hypothetical protein